MPRRRFFARSPRRPGLEAVGVHSHIGSQITALDPLVRAARAAVDLARRSARRRRSAAARRFRRRRRHLLRRHAGDRCRGVRARAGRHCSPDRADRAPRTGRVLVGPAGTLVTRVVDVKHFAGARQFVVLDAGMTELMRPALYGAFHRIEPVRRSRRRRDHRRHRRSGVREHRHVRARPRAAAGRGRRSDGRARRRRLRRGHGFDVPAPPAAARECWLTRAGGASFDAGRRSTTC